jgi:PKD repeat protein
MQMKRIIYSCVCIVSLTFAACKKNGSDPAKDPLTFRVEPSGTDSDYNIYISGSLVQFTNLSETSDEVNYQWRFGDGETATGYSSSHMYAGPGTYTVWLIQYRGSNAIDSSSSTVQVLATPKAIKRSQQYNSHPAWIACYGDKIYLAGWQAGVDNFYNRKEWFVTQYDTLWGERWTKTFSPDDGFIGRINITANGDLLMPVSKNIGDKRYAKLIRMDAAGNIKWTWNSAADDVLISLAAEDRQGNIIMTGSKRYPDPFYTAYVNGIAIQLDAAGNQKWTYAWPGMNTMDNCSRLVALNDGYIITGNKSGGCTLTCDSAHIAKLSTDGKIVWNTVIPWTAGSTTGWDVFTVLDQANKLRVVSSRSASHYIFDLNGKFLSSHAYAIAIDPVDVQINKSGSMLVLGDRWATNRESYLVEVKADGSNGWTHNVYKTMGYFNLAPTLRDTWSMSMAISSDNKALMTGRLVYYPAGSSIEGVTMFVTHANANGKLK